MAEEWDGSDSRFLGTLDGVKRKPRKGKKKKDEPMKPITVIRAYLPHPTYSSYKIADNFSLRSILLYSMANPHSTL
jgi:hypothetical protein